MPKHIMDFEHPTLQGVHCRLHLNNSSKFDCIRFAYNCMGNKKEVLRVKIALLTKKVAKLIF